MTMSSTRVQSQATRTRRRIRRIMRDILLSMCHAQSPSPVYGRRLRHPPVLHASVLAAAGIHTLLASERRIAGFRNLPLVPVDNGGPFLLAYVLPKFRC